jgi:hypothetical protein
MRLSNRDDRPSDSYDRIAYVRNLIAARCGDVLTRRRPCADRQRGVGTGDAAGRTTTTLMARQQDDPLDKRAQAILDTVRERWRLLSDLEIDDRMNRVEY